MDRQYVASSNIASIGYDEPSQTLEVEFLNGTVYQYYNVPLNMYESMMKEGSKGRFLNTYIKNAYPFSRV
ncbi:KTSC domain-containing protein [Parahaliea mediterranea]|uniref:KTSC domain-containing protein n=1 Tax=Parahaliea mediterranea TaxID=651086 RepID=A0A939IHT9_9GAMM|nr:KTSC domain-containing protein [Parahaliea mediterranea]MBN7795869.1 KTSC domain-containing protein [Parahaliea mediterranea]